MPADHNSAPLPEDHAAITGPIVALLQTAILPEIHAAQRLIRQMDDLAREEDRCAAMATVAQMLRQSRRRFHRIRVAQLMPYQGMYVLDEALRYALAPADAFAELFPHTLQDRHQEMLHAIERNLLQSLDLINLIVRAYRLAKQPATFKDWPCESIDSVRLLDILALHIQGRVDWEHSNISTGALIQTERHLARDLPAVWLPPALAHRLIDSLVGAISNIHGMQAVALTSRWADPWVMAEIQYRGRFDSAEMEQTIATFAACPSALMLDGGQPLIQLYLCQRLARMYGGELDLAFATPPAPYHQQLTLTLRLPAAVNPL